MRVGRSHKTQPELTLRPDIVGELADPGQQSVVFHATDFLSAAKSGLDVVHVQRPFCQ
jgi:hypothetical protein